MRGRGASQWCLCIECCLPANLVGYISIYDRSMGTGARAAGRKAIGKS